MRPTLPSAARDASRLCARCRLLLQTRLASSLASPSLLRHRPAPRPLITALNAGNLIQQRSFSGAAAASDNASTSNSSSATSASTPPSTQSPPPPPQTMYGIFPETLPSGPPPAGHFPIDGRALRREFLRLQARAHPDMHPASSKARAEATSALINEAYKTLLNPLLRAQYLLSLRGVDVANDETLKVEEPGLLGLVLEAHEEIMDAECEDDLAATRALNDERISASEGVLERAFREDDVEAAKKEAVRLRYWVNIKESLDNWEDGKPVVLQH